MLNARQHSRATNLCNQGEDRVRNLHAGAGRRLAPPQSLIRSSENELLSDARSAIVSLYGACQGYPFSWGDLLEDRRDGATIYHFIPHANGYGTSLSALKATVGNWAAGVADALQGYVRVEPSAAFVALSLRAEHQLAREWLAEVFLPMYWVYAVERWIEQWEEGGALKVAQFEPAPDTPVLAIFPRTDPGKATLERIHFVLITKDDLPRMCYATFELSDGLSTSPWMQLPHSGRPSDAVTVDFLIDFYKGIGAGITETVGIPAWDVLRERISSTIEGGAAHAPAARLEPAVISGGAS